MIDRRLRGLTHLYVLAVAGIVTGLFFGWVPLAPLCGLPELSPELELWRYDVAVMMGVAIGAPFWAHRAVVQAGFGWFEAARIATRQVVFLALAVFALIVGTKDPAFSRLFLCSYLLLTWAVMVGVNRRLPRSLASLVFYRRQRVATLVVGPPAPVARVAGWLSRKEQLGIATLGWLWDGHPSVGAANGLPWLGRVEHLPEQIRRHTIGQVVLVQGGLSEPSAAAVADVCEVAGCRLLIYDDFTDRIPPDLAPLVEDEHLLFVARDEPLEDPVNRVLKRAFDLVVAVPVVLFLLPLLCCLVWLVQRCQSPGPLFFVRPRGGQQGRAFNMVKFRSMHVPAPGGESEAKQATRGDPRIFPGGRFLRKTSLDEIPQFWNVLVGDMSVVGPRPHLPQHDLEFSTVSRRYRTRQLVKPGITGLAQVEGYRGEITNPVLLHRRIQADILYITSWSLLLDLKLTVRTFKQLFRPPDSAR